MHTMLSLLYTCLPLLLLLQDVSCHKEEECVEVGFARCSHMNVDTGFVQAKEKLLPQWQIEDETKIPTYRGLIPQIKNVSRSAHLLEETTKNILSLVRKTRVGKRCPEYWLLKGIEKHVMPLIQLDKELADGLGLVMSFRCLVGSPFPNVDGTCVNEDAPDQGAIGGKFLRLLPPVSHKDGFSLRSSMNGDKQPLPSARKVAQLIRKHLPKLPVTSLLTEWSHFVSTDTVSIPESPLLEDVDCCADPSREDCEPIYFDEKDPEYSRVQCINFKRSIKAQAILGHRESLSIVSSYLDANSLYGVTNEEAFERKEGYFGYLKFPASWDTDEERDTSKCKFPSSFEGCFGLDHKEDNFFEDLNLLFLMEHNRLADALSEINPHFDDSLLYNEARRITLSQYNAILFGQFLPTLVGMEIAKNQSLTPGSEGPSTTFMTEINPGILTSYALGANRNPSMDTEWRKGSGKERLRASQFDSVRDQEYVDLLAMEIQRSRDHALASYRSWRGFCDHRTKLDSWEDFETIFSKEIIKDLKELYDDQIADLDINIALLESAEDEALVGKVYQCIMLDQFARLRTGNRLFWEHDTSMLSEEQKEAISKTQTAADLLCRHFKLSKVAANPFLQISETNPEIDCKYVKPINLEPWVDTSLIEVMKEQKEKEEREKREKEEEANMIMEEKIEAQLKKEKEEKDEQKNLEAEELKKKEEQMKIEAEELKKKEAQMILERAKKEEEEKKRIEQEKKKAEEELKKRKEQEKKESERKKKEEERKRKEVLKKKKEEEELKELEEEKRTNEIKKGKPEKEEKREL